MSSKPLALSWFITLLWKDISDKTEQRERRMRLNALIVKVVCSFSVIFVIYAAFTAHLGEMPLGRDRSSALSSKQAFE